MSKKVKLFLVCLILSLFFWWGVNILEKGLEDFFYTRELEKQPSILQAQISSVAFSKNQPVRKEEVPDLNISAKSAISVFVDSQGKESVLFQKNESEKLPIASLTKLMTALVALDIYELSDKVKISKEAIEQEGEEVGLKVGEILSVNELLHIMLIESSNDAAYALATRAPARGEDEPLGSAPTRAPARGGERMREEGFVDLMNLEAEHNVGLNPETTHFINSTGLDPRDASQETNYSTARDLAKLAKYLLQYKPEILKILSQKENGTFHYHLENTNELLGEIEGIIGGKTGYTKRAGGCLLLILKGPRKDTFLINVILGSKDRFEEMKQLINWTKEAFKF